MKIWQLLTSGLKKYEDLVCEVLEESSRFSYLLILSYVRRIFHVFQKFILFLPGSQNSSFRCTIIIQIYDLLSAAYKHLKGLPSSVSNGGEVENGLSAGGGGHSTDGGNSGRSSSNSTSRPTLRQQHSLQVHTFQVYMMIRRSQILIFFLSS